MWRRFVWRRERREGNEGREGKEGMEGRKGKHGMNWVVGDSVEERGRVCVSRGAKTVFFPDCFVSACVCECERA